MQERGGPLVGGAGEGRLQAVKGQEDSHSEAWTDLEVPVEAASGWGDGWVGEGEGG